MRLEDKALASILVAFKMCESLKTEIVNLKASLEIIEREISEMDRAAEDSTEESAIDDKLMLLENARADLECKINKLLELQQYQTLCDHEFVTDLIDITPDKSETIVYCKHCMYSKV